MVVKIYVSGISGNKEVKKRQQRVLMILDSKNIGYAVLDITEPGKESDKEFMQQNSKTRESKYPLPPQIFNEEVYCGDYEEFDLANENDELEKFLKMPESATINNKTISSSATTNVENGHINGNTSSRENSADKDTAVSGDQQVPESQESTRQPEERTDILEHEMTNETTPSEEHGSVTVNDEKMEEDVKSEVEDDDEEEEKSEVDHTDEKDDSEPAGEE